MSQAFEIKLPAGRLEERFTEKRPLYGDGEAQAEAERCLYCVDAPCSRACPTGIDVAGFIHKIATGHVKGAARTILSENLLGRSCGQVCPVEVLCAGACVQHAWGREAIAIGSLQRYAVTSVLSRDPRLFSPRPATGKRVALVGAGPASLTAAGLLGLEGHRVVIFERGSVPGGLNTLGIAPYKMSAQDALAEIAWVLTLGDIELRTGVEVVARPAGPGQTEAEDLLLHYDAVFLGLGLGGDKKLGIPGEDGPRVFGATELIARIKSDPQLTINGIRRAVVVGGGNTAIDIGHELALLGLDVTLVYRRGESDMSAYDHEVAAARVAGVRVIERRVPLAFLRDRFGDLTGVRVGIRDTGGQEGRPAQEDLAADLVAVAIGQSRATQVALAFPGVRTDGRGCVIVDSTTHRTGNARVWSGGDCVNGGKEVVDAVAEAKVAARDMLDALAMRSETTWLT